MLCGFGAHAADLSPFPTSVQTTNQDAEHINDFGFLAEKVIHGNPSGIDNAVACFGGAIKFTKGKEQVQLAMPSLRICLTNTRIPRSTKALVAEVGRRKALLPGVVDPMLTSMLRLPGRVAF